MRHVWAFREVHIQCTFRCPADDVHTFCETCVFSTFSDPAEVFTRDGQLIRAHTSLHVARLPPKEKLGMKSKLEVRVVFRGRFRQVQWCPKALQLV